MEIDQETNADADQVAAGQTVSQILTHLQIGSEARMVIVGAVYTGPVTIQIITHQEAA